MRRALLAGCLVLAGACASPPPATTVCEGRAQPAARVHDPAVEASFRLFAETWLARVRRASAATGRQVGDQLETELRPTGDERAPWIGVLRYCERRPGVSTVVTELFRYERGEWVH
jgi:hypothetical protein